MPPARSPPSPQGNMVILLQREEEWQVLEIAHYNGQGKGQEGQAGLPSKQKRACPGVCRGPTVAHLENLD